MASNRTGKPGNFRPQHRVEKLSVMVSFIESSCMLWVQDMATEAANTLMNLSTQLEEYCATATKLDETPQSSVIYATQYSEDNNWYRCVLRNTLASDKVRVHYIDYGNYETMNANQLVSLPDALTSIPMLACKLWLQNVKVVESRKKEAQDALRELTEGKMLTMTRLNPLADGSGNYGLLYDSEAEHNIIDVMLQKGVMQAREFTPRASMNQNNPDHQHVPQRSRINSAASDKYPPQPSPSQNLAPTQNAMPQHSPTSPQPEKFPSPAPHEFVVRPSLMNQHPQTPPTPSHQHTHQHTPPPDGKIDSQKDAILSENALLRQKLKSMQEEFNKLSSRTANTTSYHDKIQQTCKLADKVRKCRVQFPTDTTDDLIEDTINLLSEEEAFSGQRSIPSLTVVSQKSDEYAQAQECLLHSTDQAELAELIEARDSKRQEFCEALETYLNDPSIATLEERDDKVKLASMNFDRQYQEFLRFMVQKQLPISELAPLYIEWKNKQTLNFKTLRQETSMSENAICKAFNQIAANFSLSDDNGSPNLEFSFDQLLKAYASCLDRELKSTDIQQSKDSLFLATVIHNVKAACNREHLDIQNILSLTKEYNGKLIELKKWLHEAPNMDKLSATRKVIMALRSKLRHLLADLQDLEETDDADVSEKIRVVGEVEMVRHDLQSQLEKEETLLKDVAQLANEHFPELYHTHPQLKLELSLTYGDVVKSGRELDYYTLENVPHKHGIYTSHFNKLSVYIKEYTISDQRAFLSSVKAYQQLKCEYLTPLQAVFFSKSNRQAYTQTPILGQSLSEYISTHKITPQEREQIVRQAFECLQTLHSSGFTYGHLSPDTIHWTGSSLILDEMDLSGQAKPSDAWYTYSNLVFRPPEVLASVPLNKLSDLYCLGLTILWLHFPNVTFPMKHDGAPDLNLIHMDSPLRQLLDILIPRTQHWSLPETLSRYYHYLALCQKYAEEQARGTSPGLQQQQRGTSPDGTPKPYNRDASSPTTSGSTISETDSTPTQRAENGTTQYDEPAKISTQLIEHGVNQMGDAPPNDVFYQIPPHVMTDIGQC